VALRHATADKLADSLQLALEGLAHAGRRKDDASAMEMRQTSAETSPPTPATRRGGRLAVAPTLPPTPKTPTKIIPDSRTNSLLVIATPSDMAIADDLIAQLDVPTPEGRGQIHVHYLNHIDAEELASVLTAQATEITRLTEASASPGTEAPPRTRAQPGRGEAPAGSRSPKSAGTTPTGLTITAHKPTNSLLIIAPAEAYAIMKTIIEKLDIRRPQVLVESLIAEVSMDQTEALGVEWRLLDEPNGTQVFGSSLGTDQSGVLNTLSTNPLAGQPGLILGVLRHAITIGGKEVFNIPAVLRAVQGNTNVNVLANPNLLAIDNQEAQIIIGEERPFLRSTSQTPGGGVIQTARTFEFKDTGITLRITPKVSQNKTVRLNLFLELTAFVSESEVGAVTTTKRSAQTSLIIDDGQTIIVGGLIQTDNNVAQNQVPCLGNVPLFGWLFKQTSTRKRKTNLLIFLTPHIIDTPDEARRITEHTRQRSEKADEIGEQLRQHQPQENRELLLD
jgi:general secretion pathway protein D